MSFLFGGAPPSTRELVQRYKSTINRSVRELDRETAKLKAQERVLMSEIKRHGVANFNMTRQKAKAVVRTRRIMGRFSSMKSHLQDVSSRIQGVSSMESLQTALGAAVGVMKGFSLKAGGSAMLSTLRDFEKFNGVMAVQSEMTDEGLNDTFDEENEDDEIESVACDVLREAGVNLADIPLRVAPPETSDDAMVERLARLRV